ncbi:hypothetical protein GGR57DRAFT_279487 [Xylariaceae sp. FL1272]|nr:hypothetical protein GGR57DRAFT_279487 [Xylariaceae sp. FL1272]
MTTEHTRAKRKRADTSSTTDAAPGTKRQRLNERLNLTSDDSAKLFDAIDSRYDVHLQSVLSGSKMQQRVKAAYNHLEIPILEGVVGDHTSPTPRNKITILRAHAPFTGKLISIAEIVKRKIEEEAKSRLEPTKDNIHSEGRWYQYIALGEEKQLKPRVPEETIIEDTVLGGHKYDEEDNDMGEGDDFEVMKTPFERAIQGQPKFRTIPIMSLFLSRTPVDELRKRYGEQTNVTAEQKGKR